MPTPEISQEAPPVHSAVNAMEMALVVLGLCQRQDGEGASTSDASRDASVQKLILQARGALEAALAASEHQVPAEVESCEAATASHDGETLSQDEEDSEDNEPDAESEWRRLALQFDGHRIQSLWHLRALLQYPEAHAEAAREFLAAPPLSGEDVLAERLALMLGKPPGEKVIPGGPEIARNGPDRHFKACLKMAFSRNAAKTLSAGKPCMLLGLLSKKARKEFARV